MECLQYEYKEAVSTLKKVLGFKPCYKWNAFNTKKKEGVVYMTTKVLNLVINGMPSILSFFNVM